jgi:hypothetical protein
MKNHSPNSEDGFPESVIHKSSRAMIYRFRNRGGYRYEVRYHDSEECLQRSTFKTYGAAKKQASNLVREMAGGGLDFLSLRGSERRVYERAVGLLHNSGIELDNAIAQFVQARAILKDTATLIEAAEYLVENRPSVASSKTVRFVVTELVKAKEADGMSQLYGPGRRVGPPQAGPLHGRGLHGRHGPAKLGEAGSLNRARKWPPRGGSPVRAHAQRTDLPKLAQEGRWAEGGKKLPGQKSPTQTISK